MTDKSHVTMEQKLCAVCTKRYDSGAILLDKRLRPVFERHTVTGWGLCEECTQMTKDRVALVEIDPFKSGPSSGKGMIDINEVYRTGNIAWMRTEVYEEMFNTKADGPVAFVDINVFQKIQMLAMPPGGHA